MADSMLATIHETRRDSTATSGWIPHPHRHCVYVLDLHHTLGWGRGAHVESEAIVAELVEFPGVFM